MKARLIVNPTAGTDAAVQHLTQINERIRQRVGLLDIVITTGEGDAARAAEDAVRSGYDHVFVGGGDGTLNEVLNGIGAVSGRSEERRVGKECRSRWSPEQLKKKKSERKQIE